MKSIVISISLTLAMLAGSLQGDALENQVKVQLRGNAMANAPVIETVRLYRKSYALVIGIDNYHKGWPRLSGAVKDANMVANVLRANGFNVELRLNLNSLELNKTLKTFFAIKGKAPDSRLFLWYAGHGHTVNGEGYLVPADAPDPNSDQFLVNALPMRDFGSLTRLANSKHVLSVFDSCFSGTVFQTRGGPVSATITRKTTLPVREFITSGDAGQQVQMT